jgi:hypothetical protein
MDHFTPVAALAGGLLIGLGTVALMLSLGRIAGISGIAGDLFDIGRRGNGWQPAFIVGLILGPLGVALIQGALPEITVDASPLVLIVAGALVGFGTQLGNGCTSGHGVCGLARLSARSLVATLVFMGVAALVVFVQRHVLVG